MDNDRRPPPYRPGRSGKPLSSLSQSLSFHASPQSFLGTDDAQNVPNFVRAKILNRDVTVISSYRHCREILEATEGDSTLELLAAQDGSPISPNAFTACSAYRELMADFFPAPNLLLLDAPNHSPIREKWNAHMVDVSERIPLLVRDCVKQHMERWNAGSTIDLYENMKDLSWEILLAIFLGLTPGNDSKYSTFVSLQEDLLRGQFSLFPVSVRVPFWRSARSRGLNARAKLQALLREEVAAPTRGCPFAQGGEGLSNTDRAANVLLFTSSIAVKSLASLLTASLLNLFLYPHCEPSLAAHIRSQGPDQGGALLRSILRETERLSPPVVGIMRRVEQDIRLGATNLSDPSESFVVPAGWDVWLYFVGAARDESVYPQANRMMPERFLPPAQPEPGFAFGAGEKKCLGEGTVRAVVEIVASVMLDEGWELAGAIDPPGVRGWLGWTDKVSLEQMAKDLKQLPAQRPREPLRLQLRRG